VVDRTSIFLLQPEEKWPVTKLQNVPENSLETKKEIYAIEAESVI
jgi:hypothetical protein